ncbi:GNAT family N-acetyltransferase [Polycladomyces sp. WAk]|uniref:GNAT family N-acetyltransferase n=1 Tax=Polycladomyces zharkentensis TaxID=2807616 RepID=A0ABS2WJX8_9BACL|nr:GNAT family N-acetyltransferase [Polycladomyces sp. WAk]MBN2909785.1 GNAT family N-acetyltransferase [Polycladomyces sp. WAk]
MEIRLLTPSDAPLFQTVRLQALKEQPDAFAATYEETAAQSVEHVAKRLSPTPESFVIGAFQDKQLVGNVGFKREKGKKLRHKAVIWGMYVVPEVRRHGVGKALLKEIIARAREMEGLEQLMLTVNAENEPARRLYRSMGFCVFATEPRAMKEGNRYVDEDHMILFLNATPIGGQAARLTGPAMRCAPDGRSTMHLYTGAGTGDSGVPDPSVDPRAVHRGRTIHFKSGANMSGYKWMEDGSIANRVIRLPRTDSGVVKET